MPWDVHGIKTILIDHQNRLWVGLKAGLAWWAGNSRQVFNVNSNGFMPAVRALAETPDGNIWAAADDGTIFRCTREKLEAFHATDALAGQPIYALHADNFGTLWAGTLRGGLVRFKNGKICPHHCKAGFAGRLIPSFRTALPAAIAVVVVELGIITWVRNRYMETPPLSAALQVGLGGVLVFATGILIRRAD